MNKWFRVAEDFYPRPDLIRKEALLREFHQPVAITGWRTKPFFPSGIRRRIEARFGVRIRDWHDDPEDTEFANGVFFSAFSHGERSEHPTVHADEPPDWITLLVYLNPRAPLNAGTSFWRHRETGLTSWPNAADARRLGRPVNRLRDQLERDAGDRRLWTKTDSASNVYNRAVAYPGGMLHSASRHFGSNLENGRLYQLFHFSIREMLV